MGIVGYARVSTREQNPDAQVAELVAASAQRVFVGRGESSRTADLPEWAACLDYLRAGDTLVVRAGRYGPIGRLATAQTVLTQVQVAMLAAAVFFVAGLANFTVPPVKVPGV